MDTQKELRNIKIQQKFANYEGEDRVILAEELLQEIKNDSPKIIYNTGISSLDTVLGGFRRGQLIVLSAATGQGKTSFCQSLTEKFLKDGHRCLWFSYEVGLEEFMEKMPEGGRAFHLPKQLKQNSIQWIEDRIIEGIAKYNNRVIFLDHLHYLLELQKMAEAKSLSLLIGMLLRELKKIALEHDVLIFLVSHLKKIELTEQPELSDLRDSSFVAQESDIVLMLWRVREKFNGEWIETNRAKVAVRKNRRTGKLGVMKLKYTNNRFEEDFDNQSLTEIYKNPPNNQNITW